jgi:hypothetical protein
MQTAREQAYERIDDIVVPNMYYRDDISEPESTATATDSSRGGISGRQCSDPQPPDGTPRRTDSPILDESP